MIGDSQIPAELGQTITGALANIPFPFGIDSTTGEYGYYKAGADTVTPFKTGSRTVLWTNPSSTSGFPMQTITLSDALSNYDYIDVEAYYYTDRSKPPRHTYYSISDFKNSLAASGTSHDMSLAIMAVNNGDAMSRWISYVSDNEIRISRAYYIARNGYTESYAVPLSIAGIKGSL